MYACQLHSPQVCNIFGSQVEGVVDRDYPTKIDRDYWRCLEWLAQVVKNFTHASLAWPYSRGRRQRRTCRQAVGRPGQGILIQVAGQQGHRAAGQPGRHWFGVTITGASLVLDQQYQASRLGHLIHIAVAVIAGPRP